jgi:hypothetical protein
MGSTTKPLSAASPGNAEAAGPIFRSREQDHALPYLHLLPRHDEHLGRPDSRPAKRGTEDGPAPASPRRKLTSPLISCSLWTKSRNPYGTWLAFRTRHESRSDSLSPNVTPRTERFPKASTSVQLSGVDLVSSLPGARFHMESGETNNEWARRRIGPPSRGIACTLGGRCRSAGARERYPR